MFEHCHISTFEWASGFWSNTDLVPRSRFGGSRTKKQGRGEGKGEEETRSGKIRIETSADWLFRSGRESSTRVLFLSLASAKNTPKKFYRTKNSTEHDKMYLNFQRHWKGC